MPTIRAVLGPVVVLLLAGCAATAPAREAAPVSETTATVPTSSGTRTVVERRVGGGALVVTVTEGPGGAVGVMEAVDEAGERTLVVEEVVLRRDHYVHIASAEGALLDRAAWIHFDLADERHVGFLEENPLGVVAQAATFDAEAGDPLGSDVVERVERRDGSRRVLHLVEGITVHVQRTRIEPAPAVGPPDSLPVVRFEDMHQLVDGSG